MTTRTLFRSLAVTLCLALMAVFAVASNADHHKKMKADGDIVAVASGDESFSTLVTALKEADLVGALQGDGPFTVFAPTNAAFDKLPAGTLESLLADKEKLAAVLTYHVVPGKVTASQVVSLDRAETLQGGSVSIDASNGRVMVGGAKVVKADVMASNGVIHVIDTVLIPAG